MGFYELALARRENRDRLVRIFLVGAGIGGRSVLARLLRFNWVDIVGVSDVNPTAPGMVLARDARIPIFEDAVSALGNLAVDIVFELTGDKSIYAKLVTASNGSFDVVSGDLSYFLWSVLHELDGQEVDLRGKLGEHRVLAEINVMLAHSKTPTEVFDAIVMGGMRITEMPAGSIAIYNKDEKHLILGAAKGFSKQFTRQKTFPVRPGGLTEYILLHSDPILISDLSEHPSFNNPYLMEEGIRSLIAIPLLSDREPVGVLYLDDFRPRTFPSGIDEAIGLLATQAVIAIQTQQALDRIKDLSRHDPLTGLYNRRHLNDVFVAEVHRALRMRHPFSVMLVDIDHFKEINDRFGHSVGDQALQALAHLFGHTLRPYDTAVRYGGEEFLILLPETRDEEAVLVGERLRREVESAKLLPEESPMTCSFGVSALRKDNQGHFQTPEDLIDQADKALYMAKASGRNRVCLFGATPSPVGA